MKHTQSGFRCPVCKEVYLLIDFSDLSFIASVVFGIKHAMKCKGIITRYVSYIKDYTK